MDGAVKMLESASSDQVSKYSNLYRKDYQRLGDCFSELAKALDIDERRVSTGFSLTQSVGNTAGILISIGKMYEDQAKRDWQPFCDKLHVYRGILTSFPDILSEHKNAMQKRKECEKLAYDQKMSNLQIQEVNRRVDVMTVSVLAEQSHFRQERDTHLKEAMKTLLAEQVDFYMTIIAKLQQAQKFFEWIIIAADNRVSLLAMLKYYTSFTLMWHSRVTCAAIWKIVNSLLNSSKLI